MSAIRSQPMYIESMNQKIFVLHYPALASAENTIIICPPAPQEIMRAQAGLTLLARRLQEMGHHVIRFDYSSTGDSEGDSSKISLDQWLEDLLQICRFAKVQLAKQRLSLIGLRIGAALAIRASTRIAIERLVLWDPILDGINYVHAMEAAHARIFTLNTVEPPFPSKRYRREQSLGFPWPVSWRTQLASISPALLTPKAEAIDVILSIKDQVVRSSCETWEAHGLNVNLQDVGEPLYWDDERYFKFRAFPTAYLMCIQALWEASNHD